MKLLPESLQQEAATAAVVAGWVLWYLDTQVGARVHRCVGCGGSAARGSCLLA